MKIRRIKRKRKRPKLRIPTAKGQIVHRDRTKYRRDQNRAEIEKHIEEVNQMLLLAPSLQRS